MKAVIMAGGKGSRISEETRNKPKPLVEIGQMPIIWHIMKIYEQYGVKDFIICCGYKGHMLKDYFLHYNNTRADHTYHLKDENTCCLSEIEDFTVTLVDTGEDTLTAGRLLQVRPYLEGEDCFFLTYGDGVADVDIHKLYQFHKRQKKCVTITMFEQKERFGRLTLNDDEASVKAFREKQKAESGYINAGFMVMNREVFSFLGNGSEMLEDGPFEALTAASEMAAYCHHGFFSPMDTLKEKILLQDMWDHNEAVWLKRMGN